MLKAVLIAVCVWVLPMLAANVQPENYSQIVIPRVIYFTLTSAASTLSEVAICSVLSACSLNPDWTLVLLSDHALDTSTMNTLINGCPKSSKVLNRVEPHEITLQDTPLAYWYNTILQRDAKHAKADLSDALRLALMWKYGGVYLDTDVISLQPLSLLPPNSLGKQMYGPDKKNRIPYVNGAVLVFSSSNEFVGTAMAQFGANYDATVFASVGPNLLWRVYQQMNNTLHKENSTRKWKKNALPTLVEKDVLYPIKFKSSALKNWFSNKASRKPWFPSTTVGEWKK